MTSIIFKEIPGHDGYFASSDGFIWSNKSGKRIKLKSSANIKSGRLQLHLGRGKMFYVHHLILFAFVGPKPQGKESCHGDSNYLNNASSNLRWDTSAANTEDQRKAGTLIGGEKHGFAKLKNSDVEIIKSLKGKMLQRKIAELFDVTQSTISVIHCGKSRTESSHKGKGLYAG